MAHFPKPFFRTSRGLWYVQLDGRQVNLGAEKAEAFKAYHHLMQHRSEPDPAPRALTQRQVIVLVDDFLEWCEKNRAPDTYRWYKDRLTSFCKSIPADLAVDQLKPHHVQKWVDSYPVTLASGSRRNLIASIKRAMKWSEEQGYIDRSPLTHMKKPGCGRKEQVVTPAQYQSLLNWCRDEGFPTCSLSRSLASKLSLPKEPSGRRRPSSMPSTTGPPTSDSAPATHATITI